MGANVVLDEFLAADIVVLGAPMYNFGIPSQSSVKNPDFTLD
jgi:FMN-dependent NADH-azoreductase